MSGLALHWLAVARAFRKRSVRGGPAVPKSRVRIEWDIVEWSGDDDKDNDDDGGSGESSRKRKAEEIEGAIEGGGMEGIA